MRTIPHPLLSTIPSVLLIGAESAARSRLHRTLRRSRFRTFVCAQFRDAAELMQFASVVVCHQPLPDTHWKAVLAQAERLPYPPSVVVTIPRPLTIDLDEANQAGVFVLLEPYDETELSNLIQRAHTEYQTVRELQSPRPVTLKRIDRVRALVRCTPSERKALTRWTESASTASFRTSRSPRREQSGTRLSSVSGE